MLDLVDMANPIIEEARAIKEENERARKEKSRTRTEFLFNIFPGRYEQYEVTYTENGYIETYRKIERRDAKTNRSSKLDDTSR